MNNLLFKYKKKLLQFALLICSFSPNIMDAQLIGGQYKGADGIQHDYLLDDGKGQPLQIGDHSDIGGTPFLQNDWTFGTLKLNDGRLLSDSLINYSLYNDQLYFKRNEKIYQIHYPVKEFTIEHPEGSNEKKIYHFQSGFPEVSKNDSATFYQVLFAGEKLQFLKWQRKRIREVYNYNGAYESDYTPIYEYFVFYPKERKIVSLGSKPSINKLIKQIPELESALNSYTAKNKMNIKKEDDLIQLFMSLNSTNR